MRTLTYPLFIAALLLAAPFGARAEEAARVSGSAASRTPGFGVGLAVGHPTAVVMRTPLGASLALAGGVGTGVLDGRGLHVHLDLQWSPVVLTETASFWLPLYVGGGLRYYDHDADRDTRYDEGHDEHFGLRVPVGVAFELKRTPLDVFVEMALILDLVVTDECRLCEDEDRVGAGLYAGARYYFGR